MNKDSPGFTFGFAAVMVIVVAILLALAAMGLKPFQVENIRQEKMKDILASINIKCEMKDAPPLFAQNIKERFVLNFNGDMVSKTSGTVDSKNMEDAFNIDIGAEYRAIPPEQRRYPLYIAEIEGKSYFIVPVVGKGLWGPIWGYLSLNEDKNTVYGATFDHKTETPGLGAEIREDFFQAPFKGKTIFDAQGGFVSVSVVKGGARPDDMHGVNAITGGTITSNGVSEMLKRTFGTYVKYLTKNNNQTAPAADDAIPADSTRVTVVKQPL